MRAAVLNQAKRFDIVELPDPTPGPGDMILRVEACGICGSDLKAVANFPAGMVLGHEFCGEIVALGRDVEGWRIGERVASLPLIGCGRCLPCAQGDLAHCESQPDAIGVGGSSGAYAELVKVGSKPTESFRLPAGLGAGIGALVEPLAVGLHAVDRAQLRRGDNAIVLGGGPVGMAVALWARHFGAHEILVSDPVAHRREQCVALGATASVDPAAESPRDAMRRIAGRDADVVFECVGVPGMVQAAIDATATHGRVVIVGVCSKPDPFVPVTAVLKELTMHFVVYYRSGDYAYTIGMLDHGRIDAAMLVTDRVDLDGFPAAFEALKAPTTQGKVLVVP